MADHPDRPPPVPHLHPGAFQRWVDAVDLAILSHRPNGEICYANSATAALVGVEANDLVGQPLEALFGRDWFSGHEAAVRAATPTSADIVSSLSLVADRERHFEVVSTVTFDHEGSQELIWLLLGNITTLVVARNELSIANERLLESNRDLEDFAYIASHDLQEPLRKIVAFGGRLRTRIEPQSDEKSLDYLTRMETASVRMQTLINDLLSLSRVTTGGQELVMVDLANVVHSVLENLEIAIEDADATVRCGSLPTIMGDSVQLAQLFQNLIGNALKFRSSERPLEIWVEAVMIGGRWLISVRDNGIGFAPEYAEKIFTVFQRLHGRSQYAGTGVGLAICRKIVERHGGAIRAQGHPGAGSDFLIDIPRIPGELAQAA